MYEANAGIIAGVEEKDRACGRTLKRSLSRSDRSPIRFVADRTVEIVDAGRLMAAVSFRRVTGSLDAESLEVTYSPWKRILVRILIRCQLSCRM